MISANGGLPAHRYTPQVTPRWPRGSEPASVCTDAWIYSADVTPELILGYPFLVVYGLTVDTVKHCVLPMECIDVQPSKMICQRVQCVNGSVASVQVRKMERESKEPFSDRSRGHQSDQGLCLHTSAQDTPPMGRAGVSRSAKLRSLDSLTSTYDFSSCFFPKFKKSAKRGFSREMTYFFGFYGPKIRGGGAAPTRILSKNFKNPEIWLILGYFCLLWAGPAEQCCTPVYLPIEDFRQKFQFSLDSLASK